MKDSSAYNRWRKTKKWELHPTKVALHILETVLLFLLIAFFSLNIITLTRVAALLISLYDHIRAFDLIWLKIYPWHHTWSKAVIKRRNAKIKWPLMKTMKAKLDWASHLFVGFSLASIQGFHILIPFFCCCLSHAYTKQNQKKLALAARNGHNVFGAAFHLVFNSHSLRRSLAIFQPLLSSLSFFVVRLLPRRLFSFPSRSIRLSA